MRQPLKLFQLSSFEEVRLLFASKMLFKFEEFLGEGCTCFGLDRSESGPRLNLFIRKFLMSTSTGTVKLSLTAQDSTLRMGF